MPKRPDFDAAQNAATNLLLQQNIYSLIIDVKSFVFKEKKVLIDSIQHYCKVVNRPLSDFTCNEFSGCCVLAHPRCNVILFDENEQNECRKNWGIAHEIGHIYLEHTCDDGIAEVEANFFAAQLIAPEIVILAICKKTGSISRDDLYQYFNLSHDAASRRIDTLSRRCSYSYSEIDKELLRRFIPIINSTFAKRFVS